jgi:hypothetical protein
MDMKELRKRRNDTPSTLLAKYEQANPSSNRKDDRLWKMTEDKARNASAIIRFLPAFDAENDLPWVRILSYGFSDENKKKYYINNSLRTFGNDEIDPVYELIGKLKDIDTIEAKVQRENMKQITSYFSNILVVSDPLARENEGKVFIFKFGTKIRDMIMEQITPDPLYPNKAVVDVTMPLDGANFRIRRYMAGSGYPSYDKSSFESVSELCDGDDVKADAALKSRYDLNTLLDRKNFGTYEELSIQLARFYNKTSVDMPTASSLADKLASIKTPEPKSYSKSSDDDDVLHYFNDLVEEKPVQKTVEPVADVVVPKSKLQEHHEDDEDIMNLFADLAE